MPSKGNTIPIEARFWPRVNKDGPTQPHMDTPCWVWTGPADPKGRSRINYAGRMEAVHRIGYELENGPIPDDGPGYHGWCVCHACDHPVCVRPDHLFLGSVQDNLADRQQKGRTAAGAANGSRTKPERRPRGSSSWNAKVTDADVVAMRRRYDGGEPCGSLSAAFNLAKSAVWSICKRKTWVHVPDGTSTAA